jgi:hypothetical protein
MGKPGKKGTLVKCNKIMILRWIVGRYFVEISGSHGVVYEDVYRLGCCAIYPDD